MIIKMDCEEDIEFSLLYILNTVLVPLWCLLGLARYAPTKLGDYGVLKC